MVGYFLKVGASFRRSEAWRKAFEDQEGRSRVLRSGRFGVGALAAFLLGEEIEVSTRHADSSEGIFFRATLGTETIELRKCQRDIGTTVRVRLKNEVARRAQRTDWYRLADPSVAWSGFRYREQHPFLPGPGGALPRHWHRLSQAEYQDVQWTYKNAPSLTCNGIVVSEARFNPLWKNRWGLSIACPNVSVFDPDGRLPLDLSRTKTLGERLPFEESLLDDVARNLVAWALRRMPESFRDCLQLSNTIGHYHGLSHSGQLPWFSTNAGTGLLTSRNLERAGIRTLAIVPFSLPSQWISSASEICLGLGLPVSYRSWSPGVGNTYWWLQVLFHDHRGVELAGCRLITTPEWADRLTVGPSNTRLPKRQLAKLRLEKELSPWVLLAYGDCPESSTDFHLLMETASTEEGDILMAEVYLALSDDDLRPTRMDEIWHGLLGQAIIPYSMEERQRVFARAFQELQPYLEAQRKKRSNTEQGAPAPSLIP